MARPAHRLVMPVKPGVRIAAVVEHAVQNQAHAFILGVLTQAQQRLVAAKLRVNVAIIFGIVFVYAGGFKHRVEIQGRHAQFFQVRQLFADAVEVAAVEGRSPCLGGQRLIPRFQNDVMTRRVVVIDLILIRRTLFAARKTVRENLVKDLIVNPVRAVIRVIYRELLQPGGRETAKPLGGKPQLAVIPQQLKAIAAARLSAVQVDIRPPRRNPRLRLAALLVHFQRRFFVIHFGAERHAFRLIFSRQPERNHKVVFVLLNKWGNRKVPGV